jgi:hypothetical protein
MGSWMNGYGNMVNEPTGSEKLLFSGKIMILYDRPVIRQKCCGNRIFCMLHLYGDKTQFLEIWSSIREVETRMLTCECIVLENCWVILQVVICISPPQVWFLPFNDIVSFWKCYKYNGMRKTCAHYMCLLCSGRDIILRWCTANCEEQIVYYTKCTYSICDILDHLCIHYSECRLCSYKIQFAQSCTGVIPIYTKTSTLQDSRNPYSIEFL